MDRAESSAIDDQVVLPKQVDGPTIDVDDDIDLNDLVTSKVKLQPFERCKKRELWD